MRHVVLPLVFSCVFSSVFACSEQNERYYAEHPKALQEVIKSCPQKAPKHISCQALQTVAVGLNELVYELRMSPQGFGHSILALQEKIAKEQSEILQNDHDSIQKTTLNQDQKALRQRLAIVGWLESPEQ